MNINTVVLLRYLLLGLINWRPLSQADKLPVQDLKNRLTIAVLLVPVKKPAYFATTTDGKPAEQLTVDPHWHADRPPIDREYFS